ncbi:hypothetical protein [Bdellovibrio sp. HCB209]|uniref:hypothetical protein n=1 Tax=Bdellovibrio sp. HCB209 TaxID=3394354 RepID=UPI0039B500AA
MDRYWLSGSITCLSQVLYLCTFKYVPGFVSYGFLGIAVISAIFLFYISETYKDVIGSFLWIALPTPVSTLALMGMTAVSYIYKNGFNSELGDHLTAAGYTSGATLYLVLFTIGPVLLALIALKIGHLRTHKK